MSLTDSPEWDCCFFCTVLLVAPFPLAYLAAYRNPSNAMRVVGVLLTANILLAPWYTVATQRIEGTWLPPYWFGWLLLWGLRQSEDLWTQGYTALLAFYLATYVGLLASLLFEPQRPAHRG
jgi:hypothetical protein